MSDLDPAAIERARRVLPPQAMVAAMMEFNRRLRAGSGPGEALGAAVAAAALTLTRPSPARAPAVGDSSQTLRAVSAPAPADAGPLWLSEEAWSSLVARCGSEERARMYLNGELQLEV